MERLGLPHLDLLPPLRERYERDGVDLFYDHCHHTSQGTRFVGELVADLIARESRKLAEAEDAPADPAPPPPTATPEPPVERINKPAGLARSSAGEILAADAGGTAVYRVNGAGRYLGMFGRPVFRDPGGLAVDTLGQVNVADTWNHRIVRLTADGVPIGYLPPPPDALYAPRDIVMGMDDQFYVANTGGARITRYDKYGNVILTWGGKGAAVGEFDEPLSLAYSEQELYVGDYFNARVQVFDVDGRFLRTFPVAAWKGREAAFRPGLAIFQDRLYVADPAGQGVAIFSRQGQPRGRLTSPQFGRPSGLFALPEGTLYVSNAESGTIVAVDLASGLTRPTAGP
jgi:sugar lactone lactonase YvrE